MTLDEALLRQLIALRAPPLDVLFGAVWLLTLFGWGWIVLALLALRDGRRGQWVAMSVLLALLIGGVIADGVLKPILGRPRPFATFPEVGPYLIPAPSSWSFPSGDVAAAVAAVVAYTRFRRWWSLPLYGFAGLVALERVYFGVHYPSDVLGGAVVGVASGLLAVELVRLVRTSMPWRAVVVPHTHWDREWYETVAGYRPRLLAAVDGVVAELERPGGVDRFTFDGQTIALEDYLDDRPAMAERVDALIRAGKLLVGPWFVLSDLILVHGESTLRNMEEGLRVAAAHGRAMRVGYVADPFGHPAQMPQILRGFGYGAYVFARGLGEEGEVLGAEFEWEAPSGDRVLAIHLVGHYDNALWLLRDRDHVESADGNLRRRLRRELPRLLARETRYAHSDVLLLMVGTDHMPITPELLPALQHARELRPSLSTRIGTLEDAVGAYPPMTLPVHHGELVQGKYRPILRAVNSTRMWIKQENAACERLLLSWVEPLAALTGRATRDDIRPLWRTLLQCHPHDSICGCSIDAVHDVDMRERFRAVRRGGERLRQRLIAETAAERVAWNSTPFPRTAVVDLGDTERHAFVRFDGLGAAALGADRPEHEVSSPTDGVLDNGLIRVEVGMDGTFFVEGPGGRTGPHNLLLDEGDRGDEYTYSYAGPPVRSGGRVGERNTFADPLTGSVRVRLRLPVPVALRPDRRARDERLVELPIETTIRLDAG
ncbi:MAG TPA: phosphatase PAP2 family protein, partial [Candidatus Limnocylindria bacterium]|nr:phosphatase PAP2 family protein [Candidatus Limnocylindria bacterium]